MRVQAHGVMIGRAFQKNLWLLRDFERELYGCTSTLTVPEALNVYSNYVVEEITR